MTFLEDTQLTDEPRRSFILGSIRARSFNENRELTIPKYDKTPPYFDKKPDFNVVWSENPPLDDISIHGSISRSLVDKYVARNYTDLLSDEKANRDVLNWLRQFKNNGKMNKKKEGKKINLDNKRAAAVAAAEDGKNVRHSHILLLTGPPGCGKSTLIRVAANHCGYHIIELNASEDTKNERNQILLQNQLDFEPVFGKKTKPLLVLEELDGAGTMNDSVIKAALDLTGKPVIVVVNNLYSPGLRNLRAQADIIKMDHPLASKFVKRIQKIAELENIKYDNQAIIAIAEQSHYDVRTAINTLQFLSIRQPVTPEMVQLMPVGIKNATFTYFDIMTQLFTQSSKLEDTLLAIESFGDNQTLLTGILENVENVKIGGPAKRRIADVLDNLSFADTSYGEIAALGFAGIPKAVGVTKLKREIMYPIDSITRENTIRRNQTIFDTKMRQNMQLFQMYMDPDHETFSALTMRGNDLLRQKFVDFHRYMKVSYKKSPAGIYTSEPDIDSLLAFNRNFNYNNNSVTASSRLNKFRELIQRELDKDNVRGKDLLAISASGQRIGDKLNKSHANIKNTIARDFWGNRIEIGLSQMSVDRRLPMYYRYNEGFTNAVRRVVMLDRILEE